MSPLRPILAKMTAALALAIFLGAPVGALESPTPPAAETGVAPADTTKAPPPATAPADKKDEGKPAISKEDFEKVFSTGYDQYTAMKGESRTGFEARFTGFTKDRGNPENVVWFRSMDAQFTGKEPRIDLTQGKAAVNEAARTVGGCEGALSKDPNCKPVPKQPDPNMKPTLTDVTGKGDEFQDGKKKDPVADAKFDAPKPPAVDDKFKTVLRNGAFGAIAGAVVGIGLLPLLGPFGIVLGALMGAAIMVAAKKLGN